MSLSEACKNAGNSPELISSFVNEVQKQTPQRNAQSKVPKYAKARLICLRLQKANIYV